MKRNFIERFVIIIVIVAMKTFVIILVIISWSKLVVKQRCWFASMAATQRTGRYFRVGAHFARVGTPQVATLLELGADRTAVDTRGRTPEECTVDPLVKGIFAEDAEKAR